MLSILIPVYNYDIRAMVEDLFHQAKDSGIPFEIICVDDHSDPIHKRNNQFLADSDRVDYEELKENIGRSKIRNYLVQKAQYDWLLFLDCDTAFPDASFIKRYVQAKDTAAVIVGGRLYAPTPPEDLEYYFHWKYGSRREVRKASERAELPYYGFMTNNFAIDKKVFQQIQFDPKLKQYGHEDTLFGQQLAKQKITITHIENPTIHTGLETTSVFLQKSKMALDNLAGIQAAHPEITTRILQAYKKFQPLFRLLHNFFPTFLENSIYKNLNSSRPSLKLFDIYRLLYLSNAINKKQ